MKDKEKYSAPQDFRRSSFSQKRQIHFNGENKMCTERTKNAVYPQQYLIIWQSELQFMTGLAARTGCIETGGEMYGLQTHAGRLVIMLATPPGPNASHEIARFQQDIEFFRKTNSLLMNQFGI
ncbi:MAG: hypothetical protein KAR20_00405, partial [Candidatus Heimdallarchaeota archaeon]|nr:hypothetical protein [Candidatus Heimdallarchaeota archaeon]